MWWYKREHCKSVMPPIYVHWAWGYQPFRPSPGGMSPLLNEVLPTRNPEASAGSPSTWGTSCPCTPVRRRRSTYWRFVYLGMLRELQWTPSPYWSSYTQLLWVNRPTPAWHSSRSTTALGCYWTTAQLPRTLWTLGVWAQWGRRHPSPNRPRVPPTRCL